MQELERYVSGFKKFVIPPLKKFIIKKLKRKIFKVIFISLPNRLVIFLFLNKTKYVNKTKADPIINSPTLNPKIKIPVKDLPNMTTRKK